jgi:hypothetical protein
MLTATCFAGGLGAIPSLISNAFSFVTGISVAVESAVWTLSDDMTLNLGWINSNGVEASSTSLLFVEAENALVMTGDVNVFRSSFGYSADVSTDCVSVFVFSLILAVD